MSGNSEFDIIRRYFRDGDGLRSDVLLGIGDDCALLQPPSGQVLAVSSDLLAADVHFFADADPEGIGHKALAVNLSDLAAQGAEPAWATLSIALASADEHWLQGFSRGWFQLAAEHRLQLVGGDTTRGPTTIAVTVMGFVPPDQALRRDGARPGDSVWVTGTLGDAALALAMLKGEAEVVPEHHRYLRQRLERPTPQVAVGLALRGVATSAIDISDGLAQDLGHILAASNVGAVVDLARLPRSAALAAYPTDTTLWQLAGGDDYELCFSVPPERRALLLERAARWDCPCSEIGTIQAAGGLQIHTADGRLQPWQGRGYDHFRHR